MNISKSFYIAVRITEFVFMWGAVFMMVLIAVVLVKSSRDTDASIRALSVETSLQLEAIANSCKGDK